MEMTSPAYLLAALNATTGRCEICRAQSGQSCHNTIRPDIPLPGRTAHLARTELKP